MPAIYYRRIILLGTSGYELYGLACLLAGAGYRPERWAGQRLYPEDVFLVALSDEPLLDWGRHLALITRLRRMLNCHLHILVPALLAQLPALSGGGISVGLGCPHALLARLDALMRPSRTPLRAFFCRPAPRLPGRMLLASPRPSHRLQIPQARQVYYQRARLLKWLGLKNFHQYSVAGLHRLPALGRCRLEEPPVFALVLYPLDIAVIALDGVGAE